MPNIADEQSTSSLGANPHLVLSTGNIIKLTKHVSAIQMVLSTSYAVEYKNNKENLFMKVNNNSNGIGFVGALTIAFIVLKLMKIIDWSWWWVLSPLWISALVAIVVIAIVFLVIWLGEIKRG